MSDDKPKKESEEPTEEESLLSDNAKKIAGLAFVGGIVALASWMAFAPGESALDKYLGDLKPDPKPEPPPGGAEGQGGETTARAEALEVASSDGDGDGDGGDGEGAEQTLWEAIVGAFGENVTISVSGGGSDNG